MISHTSRRKTINPAKPKLKLNFRSTITSCTLVALILIVLRVICTDTMPVEVATPVTPVANTATMTTAIDSYPHESSKKAYDPKDCKNMVGGHCQDEDGRAWSYRRPNGDCIYKEGVWAPVDPGARDALPRVLDDVTSVLDFGGGIGAYLTALRDKGGVFPILVAEPQPLKDCLWSGIEQDTTDWINTPLAKLPNEQYDLIMTVEVLEHIPVQFHQHLIQAFAQATRKWLYFSAAHPGQPGEGHVGPSMKMRTQWIDEIQNWTSLRVDHEATGAMWINSTAMLKSNSVVFRK